MTARPGLAVIEAAVLDDRNRLRPAAARTAVAVFRCAGHRHWQCIVARTTWGLAVVWREAVVARAARDVVTTDWLDAAPAVIRVTCHCRVSRSVDLMPYRETVR